MINNESFQYFFKQNFLKLNYNSKQVQDEQTH